jgi:hypothetical protein
VRSAGLILRALVRRIARGTTSSGLVLSAICRKVKSTSFVTIFTLFVLTGIYRYVNMDYLVLSSLKFSPLETLIVSYDIVCQWNKNLWERMKTYPHSIQLNRHSELVVVFLVPKFHLPAHIEKCQKQFSFNLTPHVGRTDGEAPERGWANSNPLSSSTKEMGPGSRRDTLDDHFGDWNYKKVIGLGKSADIDYFLAAHVDHRRDSTTPGQNCGWRSA